MEIYDPKLLVFDLDGTLLDGRGRLCPVLKASILKAQAHHLKVTLATGRMFGDTIPYARELNISLPLIVNHGALIQTVSGDILRRQTIGYSCYLELIKIARQANLAYQVYFDGGLYLEKLTSWNERYMDQSFVEGQIVPDLTAIASGGPQQIDFLGPPEELRHLRALIEDRVGSGINLTSSYKYLLEILGAEVSKGAALQFLAQYLNIPMGSIVAIGDGYNDLEMIVAAGLGVAMGRAPKEVRHRADRVLSDEPGALSEFIDALVATRS